MLLAVSMLADPKFRERIAGASSISVASCDAEGRPSTCRAVGFVIAPDAGSVTVHLPVATAAKTVANVATNGRLAIVCSNPVDHTTVQFKGRSRGVRIANEGDRADIEAWHRGFVDILAEVGMPRARTRSLTTWPAFAITLEVEAVFDQTPGPRAGERIESR